MQEYKRVTKAILIQTFFMLGIILPIFIFLFHEVFIALTVLFIFLAQLGFKYLLDINFNQRLAVGLYIVSTILSAYLIYVTMPSVFGTQIGDMIVTFVMWFILLIGLKELRIPSYVVNGYIDEQLRENYFKSFLRKTYFTLGIMVVFIIIAFFVTLIIYGQN